MDADVKETALKMKTKAWDILKQTGMKMRRAMLQEESDAENNCEEDEDESIGAEDVNRDSCEQSLEQCDAVNVGGTVLSAPKIFQQGLVTPSPSFSRPMTSAHLGTSTQHLSKTVFIPCSSTALRNPKVGGSRR